MPTNRGQAGKSRGLTSGMVSAPDVARMQRHWQAKCLLAFSLQLNGLHGNTQCLACIMQKCGA
jgi:hypothetical protein